MTSEQRPLTILCLASYEKGADFLRECKRQGCHVILLTLDKLADAAWPRESIDELFHLPSFSPREDVVNTVSYLARTRHIDRVVALEDYDVEVAAALREHLRSPGMGGTTARYFRDKLAMRVRARDEGFLVPPFVPVLNYSGLRDFMESVLPPWVLKPRSEAASVGIKKIYSPDELWPVLDELGDRQSYYVLEKYIRGDVYHVDAITYEHELLFAEVHRYGSPPLDVVHEGGLFTSRTLPRDTKETLELQSLHRELLRALSFRRGVTHTEFIKGHGDGRLYFLETAARVGGAYLVEMVQAATGINLWVEWAKIEIAGGDKAYTVPTPREEYAGIIISLARQEYPDTAAYNDPEIVWRLNERHHAGLIVASPDPEQVQSLLNAYAPRFMQDFFARQPAPDKPTS